MPREKSSIYPLNPPGSQTLVIQTANALTLADRLLVYASSVFVVGGVFWVPAFYIWAVRRFRAIPKGQVKRRALYGTLLLSLTALFVAGPHRNHRFGKCVHVKKWSLWKAWARFLALEIVADQGYIDKNLMGNQAILAVSPHGVFPFSLAFAAISDLKPFGKFRAVVASATDYFPWVRDLLKWVNAVYVKNFIGNRQYWLRRRICFVEN